LAKLKYNITVLPQLQTARTALDDAARMAPSKLVLYSETHDFHDDSEQHQCQKSSKNLQTSGRLERSQSSVFVALCRSLSLFVKRAQVESRQEILDRCITLV
jgi:hypothetical protein